VDSLEQDSRRRAERFLQARGYTNNDINPSIQIVEKLRWETRRHVQRPFMLLFLASVVLAWLVHDMRRGPSLFDNAWPHAVAQRIPLLVGRWRLRGVSEDGSEVVNEVHRTVSRARRAAKLHPGAIRFRIEWDNSGFETYEEFKRRLDLLCGSDVTVELRRGGWRGR